MRRRLRLFALALCLADAGAALGQTEPEAEPEDAATESEPESAEATAASDAQAAAEPEPAPADAGAGGMRAYQAALERLKLAATAPLSRARLREELSRVEQKLLDGRRDEAIGDLVYVIESPRFEAFAESEEGRAARFLLGDALGRAGADLPSRRYLEPLLSGNPSDVWLRRAARSMVDLGLMSSTPRLWLDPLDKLPAGLADEVRGDVSYLRGRVFELEKDPAKAFAQYQKVPERSRFWAQATYLSGVLEVERRRYKQGENLFCKVADPKLTPRQAPLFGGSDFFRVRDLARLGLGRVAHEQYRFDDARYYYYLVPHDSDHLAESLYETATTRYEAKDYEEAREFMDRLKALDVHHPYEDEAWVLDSYIELARCRFPVADQKLAEFLKRYEPVRGAARRLSRDDRAMQRLVEAVRSGRDPAAAGLGVGPEAARTLGVLLRVDLGYGQASRRLAQLDHQLAGLLMAMGDLDDARQRLAQPKELRAQSKVPLGQGDLDKIARIEAQLSEVRRLMRDASRGAANRNKLEPLQKELEALVLRAKALQSSAGLSEGPGGVTTGHDLGSILAQDRARAGELYAASKAVRQEVLAEQMRLAKDAFVRLDRRLSRLLRRARLGRIETVLGKKRALEIEVEALSQGLIPQSIVDSLDAERYLQDDEEYWPFDGEDWDDEYVGGEGLR